MNATGWTAADLKAVDDNAETHLPSPAVTALCAQRGSAVSVGESGRHCESARDPPELPLPFERGLTELSYGQVPRRWGHRRATVLQPEAARERFEALGARPLTRCATKLEASAAAGPRRGEVNRPG